MSPARRVSGLSSEECSPAMVVKSVTEFSQCINQTRPLRNKVQRGSHDSSQENPDTNSGHQPYYQINFV